MTGSAAAPAHPGSPTRSSADPSAPVAHQQLLHQAVRRELRLLGDLSGWAEPDDVPRVAVLTRHAELVSRLLLQHHACERDLLWPALVRSLGPSAGRARPALDAWTHHCVELDSQLRDVATAARQWRVALSPVARDAFATGCRALADAVEAQTAEEERELLPLLDGLDPGEWAALTASARRRTAPADRMAVLGLVLEDAGRRGRARVLGAVPRSTRLVWRLRGRRRYRAAVLRLRGAPPSA